MLDLDFIRAQPELVRQAILQKGVDLDFEEVLRLDAYLRAMRRELDDLRGERNRLSDRFRSASDTDRATL